MKKTFYTHAARPFKVLLNNEPAAGILLGACAILAMIIANSDLSETYFNMLNFKVSGLSVQHWINDGLMTIFFFVIGMEIKKEILIGELSSLRRAALPVAAAVGGMIVPAIVYLGFNSTSPNLNGWGIPMATDIAFALGILTFFGSRVSVSLKIFLLALAIVDDLGAVLVIALFYTKEIHLLGIGLAGMCFIGMLGAQKLRVGSYFFYSVLGVGAWGGFFYSGIHPTVAGVIAGLLTPLNFATEKTLLNSYSPLEKLVHFLHPWVAIAIMPIFAFFNAGISFQGVDVYQIVDHPVHRGIALGLLVGKPLGIMATSFVAVSLGIAVLPQGLRWIHIFGVSLLGGIGFTMALFISNLALPADLEIYSKTGIVFGSVAAAGFGAIILHFAFRKDHTGVVLFAKTALKVTRGVAEK